MKEYSPNDCDQCFCISILDNEYKFKFILATLLTVGYMGVCVCVCVCVCGGGGGGGGGMSWYMQP